jgi:hypothetical protein
MAIHSDTISPLANKPIPSDPEKAAAVASSTTTTSPPRQDVSHLMRVHHGPPGTYTTYSTSLVSLPAGAVFSPILTATPAPVAYSSVQTGPDSHIELNSDLVYINHSCEPSLEFDMEKMEVRVARGADLHVGDELSFFYPSTEWSMEQPFQCRCGKAACKGLIKGAREMDEGALREYWLNAHIVGLLDERERKRTEKKD